MKIPLTISEGYCKDWGIFEAIREFMQNGRDETRRGCTFDAWYLPDKQQIRLATKGAVLHRRTLLMGEGDKAGRSDMLGQHGEGYKIGSLVLLRMGKAVRFRTGTEVWVPTIEFSKKFDAKVISFEITGGRKQLDEVVIEVNGINQEEWDAIKWKFLFMDEHNFETIESPAGDILLDAGGHLFVDGLWVCQEEEFIHGYNFLPQGIDLDRDRRMIGLFDGKTGTSKIWEAIYMRDAETYGDMVDAMLAGDSNDVEHFRYNWCVAEKVRDQVAARFVEKHGKKAVPVGNASETRELEFFGRTGEYVKSDGLREILCDKIGTLHSVKAELANEIRGEYTTVDLDPEEAKNLLLARDFVAMGTTEKIPAIEIVDFGDPGVLGLRKEGRIFVAKKTLSNPIETIKTVVEEVAHVAGADGTHSHVEKIHDIYATAVAALLIKA